MTSNRLPTIKSVVFILVPIKHVVAFATVLRASKVTPNTTPQTVTIPFESSDSISFDFSSYAIIRYFQSLLKTQSRSHKFIHQARASVGGSAYMTSYRVFNTINRMKFYPARVSQLFFLGSPPTVRWFVVTVVVNPIKRMLGGRLLSHIFVKVIEVTPSITNLYTSATVPAIVVMIFVATAFTHTSPVVVLWIACFPIFVCHTVMIAQVLL